MAEHFTRCYQTHIETWSAGVVHKKPAIELHLEDHNVTVYIADDYQHLEAMLTRLLAKLRERQHEDASEAAVRTHRPADQPAPTPQEART